MPSTHIAVRTNPRTPLRYRLTLNEPPETVHKTEACDGNRSFLDKLVETVFTQVSDVENSRRETMLKNLCRGIVDTC